MRFLPVNYWKSTTASYRKNAVEFNRSYATREEAAAAGKATAMEYGDQIFTGKVVFTETGDINDLNAAAQKVLDKSS